MGIISPRRVNTVHTISSPRRSKAKKSCLSYIKWLPCLLFLISGYLVLSMFSIVRGIDTAKSEQSEWIDFASRTNLSPQKNSVVTYSQSDAYSVDDTITVGFVVTITSCGPERDPRRKAPFPISEGAAVLQHGIRKSFESSTSKRYDYKLYAVYHPDAKECASVLETLGYELVERDTPLKVEEIKGDFLRERIVTNGCCGEKELIKFEAWTLTQHRAVVLLDLDVIILQPLDELFDLLLFKKPLPPGHLMFRPNGELPETIEILHTIDYAMVSPGRVIKPVQGGFVIFKPSQEVYREIVDIVREGDFGDAGWGGKTGKFWGSMTFQGLIPYYYHILHPGTSVELNRCIYNNMCSSPRTSGGKCFTKEEECEDCRHRPVEEVVASHVTNCQKFWICLAHDPQKGEAMILCREIHHAWFQQRSEMEKSWGRSGMGSGTWNRDHFYGFCSHFGPDGYEPIQLPYGHGIPLEVTNSTN